MARQAKFLPEQIVDAAARLAARDGPAQATIGRIAAELGAPTGSIYHRFASRDALLGAVWLEAAEAFQAGFGRCLEGPDPWQAAMDAVAWVPARVRSRPREARILMLHRREDFLLGRWPAGQVARAKSLRRDGEAGLARFAARLFDRADEARLRALRFALVDIPLAAVVPHLRAGEAPPETLDPLLRAAAVAVLGAAGARPAPTARRARR
jgi:AcrR family transcriptional regulator